MIQSLLVHHLGALLRRTKLVRYLRLCPKLVRSRQKLGIEFGLPNSKGISCSCTPFESGYV